MTTDFSPASINNRQDILDATLNRIVADSLGPISLGLAVVYVVLAGVNYLTIDPAIVGLIVTLELVSSGIYFGLYAVLGRMILPGKWAHPLATFIVGVATVNNLIHVYLADDLVRTVNIYFVVMGLGLFLLSGKWVLGNLLMIVALWAGVSSLLLPNPIFPQLAVGMFIAMVLSVLAFWVRQGQVIRYEALRRQDAGNQEELAYHARQLETSIAVGQRITAILDIDDLLEEVAELIKERYGFDFVSIFLIDEGTKFVRARAGTGEVGRRLRDDKFRFKIGESGMIGWVAANGEPARADDVRQDERYVSVTGLPDIRSELDLPLRMGNRILGVLDLQSNRVAAFQEAEVPFLQMLADQVAIAIRNAFLYQSEKSARYLAETMYKTGRALMQTLDWEEVLTQILENLAKLVHYDRVSILVQVESNPPRLRVVASRGFPPATTEEPILVSIHDDESDIYREIYRTQRPLAVDDVMELPVWHQVEGIPHARSWMGVPLIRQNGVIGMLSLTKERVDPYDDEEIALAAALAAQADIALRNAQLYDELAQTNLQLERMDRTRSDFIAIAAHELRTPLTLLSGYSQMLLNDKVIQENSFHHQLVDGINSGADRLGEVVNSMLDVVKIDSKTLPLHMELISVYTLLKQLMQRDFAKPAAERSIELVLDEEVRQLPMVQGDITSLQKVFHHLFSNAIKYTPDGGSVRVYGSVTVQGGLAEREEFIKVVVEDTGVGIDLEQQELVFEKFYQTGEVALHSTHKTAFKGGGPGLGLAIARGIVEAHRGKLWVESPGHHEEELPGSQFFVMLPVRQAAAGTGAEGKVGVG
ncbi:MAG TPA: GAF domain-containing protein [Anaerolineae bacterium]|nr:GAF domain-containing protein [Anaerolineae bacterium]